MTGHFLQGTTRRVAQAVKILDYRKSERAQIWTALRCLTSTRNVALSPTIKCVLELPIF